MQFSVLIVARNASKIIVPLLEDLKNCDDVIVVNDRSTDDTLEKLHKYKNIKVIDSVELIKNHKKLKFNELFFGNEAYFRNLTINSIGYKYEWLLLLDSDERISKNSLNQLTYLKPNKNQVAYSLKRTDIFLGRKLRFSQQVSSYLRLIKYKYCKYKRPINSFIECNGQVKRTQITFEHYPFNEGLDKWIDRHIKYSNIESKKAFNNSFTRKNIFSLDFIFKNPIRQFYKNLFYLLYLRGFIKFVLLYVFRFGFLDGIPGYLYCSLIAWYETLIEIKQRLYSFEDETKH